MEENFILFLFFILPLFLYLMTRWFFGEVLPGIRHRKVLSLLSGNFLVLVLLVSVLLLPGEIYFRFIYDTTDSFGLCRTNQEWFERHFRRNLTGFRDSMNYLPFVEPGKRRITFLGDSFTVGHGIADVEKRFANRVRSRLDDCEVHVLAECGWDTKKELELVRFLPTSGYKTDVVVLVYCLNDIADITPEWQEVLDQIYNDWQPGLLARNSYLFNTISARLRMAQNREIQDYYSFVADAYSGQIWKQQNERLTGLRTAVEESGGTLCVITFPFLHAISDDYRYRDIHGRLNDFWTKSGIPHLDLLTAYEDERAESLVISRRDAHPNEYAHEIAANAIAEFLELQITKQRGSSDTSL